MTSPVDIRPYHLAVVQDILHTHLPAGFKVWVFGSRANWTTKGSSDLDLAVEGTTKLDHKVMVSLEVAFEDSNLPYTVDVVDMNAVSQGFKQMVEDQKVPLPMADDGRQTSNLRDVIDLRLSSVDKKSKEGEQPVRLCNYMDVYSNSFIHSGMDFMDATASEREIAKCSLFAGDVVITKDSEKHDDIGVPALVRENIPGLVCGYHLAILRPNPSAIDGTYLFYALKAEEAQQQFHSYANGITRFGLRKADIGLVKIPLPPLPEQRAIGHILGTLDDKIELNRRMNETLEAMARAIFRDWFVDFGPVRAKMEGREPYLPPELWSLFPVRLVDSELGQIPEGWEVGTMGELCERPQYGYTASTQTEAVGPKFLRITDINKLKWIEWEHVPYCLASDNDRAKYRLRKNDILIARIADPGHGIMVEEDVNAVFASYLIRFRPKNVVYARVLQYWLRSDTYWELVSARGSGSTRANLNAKVLGEFALVVPCASIATKFSDSINAIRNRTVSNSRATRTLANLRDALLPRLVSGELRVGKLKIVG